MARTYTCDECGKKMNGDRASDRVAQTHIQVGDKELIIRVVRGEPGVYPSDQDICWGCLCDLLEQSASKANAKAMEYEHAQALEAEEGIDDAGE